MAKRSYRGHCGLALYLLLFQHVLCWLFHVLLHLWPLEYPALQIQGLATYDWCSQKHLDLLLLDHFAQLLDQSLGFRNSATRPCWDNCIDPDSAWLWIHFHLQLVSHYAHMLCRLWHLSLCFQGRECAWCMCKHLQQRTRLHDLFGVFCLVAGDSCLHDHG